MTTRVRAARVGVRFVEAGPIAYCASGDLALGVGDYVVVRMPRGERLGWVVMGEDQVLPVRDDAPARVVDRLASESDVATWRARMERAQADVLRAQAVVSRIDGRVRVASLTYDLAGEHAELTYTAKEFNAEDRLRRDVAQALDLPDLEVEQVGDRDRAKALGGLGVCGRALCCSTWMAEFPAISIKMAKDQGLAPNPTKISGVCGRLLCCLAFEVDAYREVVGTLPKVGKRVTTPVGGAKVLSINALTETVRLRLDESGQVIEIAAEALRGQMGTAVRPEELDGEVEEAIRRQDEQRRALFLAALEPTDRPRARSSRAAFDTPGREVRDERPLRDLDASAVPEDRGDLPREPRAPRPPRQRPAATDGASTRQRRDEPRPGAGGRRRGADERPPREDARERAARGESPREAPREGRTSIGGIRITRRSARPADGSAPARPPREPREPRDGAPGERPPRPPRNEAPRPPSDGAPGSGDSEEQRRRRRRGRRGGRGRGASDGGDAGGEPTPGPGTDE